MFSRISLTRLYVGQVHGIAALLLSPLIGIIVAGFLTVFMGSGMVFGLWGFSKLKPMSLWAKDVVRHPEEAA